MWTAIRFVHVLSAIAWVGVQLTLFVLFPCCAPAGAEQFRTVARTAGMRLGIVAAITLPALLASGIALASTRCPRPSAAG